MTADRMALIELIEPFFVDSLHLQRGLRDFARHNPVGLRVGVIPHPAKAIIRQARGAATAFRDFESGVVVHFGA